jgi:hypothetical protein
MRDRLSTRPGRWTLGISLFAIAVVSTLTGSLSGTPEVDGTATAAKGLVAWYPFNGSGYKNRDSHGLSGNGHQFGGHPNSSRPHNGKQEKNYAHPPGNRLDVHGAIDEIRIYNRPLTANEVSALTAAAQKSK